MDILGKLMNAGAVETDRIQYRKESNKLSGSIWSGELDLKLHDVIYCFTMWTCLPKDRYMTVEEAYKLLTLKEVICLTHKVESDFPCLDGTSGKTYHRLNNLVYCNEKVLLHRTGWHGNIQREFLVMAADPTLAGYAKRKVVEGAEQKLIDFGFEVLVEL